MDTRLWCHIRSGKYNLLSVRLAYTCYFNSVSLVMMLNVFIDTLLYYQSKDLITADPLVPILTVVRISGNRVFPCCLCRSAGVGRSGTFIVLDRLIQHVQVHDWLDVYSTVAQMRLFRMFMVQTEVGSRAVVYEYL